MNPRSFWAQSKSIPLLRTATPGQSSDGENPVPVLATTAVIQICVQESLDRVWPARLELSAETEHLVKFRWAGEESELPR
jgi:hypothetical protein